MERFICLSLFDDCGECDTYLIPEEYFQKYFFKSWNSHDGLLFDLFDKYLYDSEYKLKKDKPFKGGIILEVLSLDTANY